MGEDDELFVENCVSGCEVAEKQPPGHQRKHSLPQQLDSAGVRQVGKKPHLLLCAVKTAKIRNMVLHKICCHILENVDHMLCLLSSLDKVKKQVNKRLTSPPEIFRRVCYMFEGSQAHTVCTVDAKLMQTWVERLK